MTKRKIIWNPWRRIRQLERELDWAERGLEEMDRQLRNAQREAFAEAEDHFEMRTVHLQAENRRLLENAITLASMEAPRIIIDRTPA